MCGRELDRRVPVGTADDIDRGDELVALRTRSGTQLGLPVAHPDRPGCLGAQRLPEMRSQARISLLRRASERDWAGSSLITAGLASGLGSDSHSERASLSTTPRSKTA